MDSYKKKYFPSQSQREVVEKQAGVIQSMTRTSATLAGFEDEGGHVPGKAGRL